MKNANRPIELVCHKGANEYAPENTYASTQLCLDWGVDYVEIDVSTSRDGVMYVIHGPTVDKTTDGRGRIDELTSSEIDQLDAGSWFSPEFAGEKVPRLAPFLHWIKGKAKLFLDVKDAELTRLLPLIYGAGLEQDCFFWFKDDAQAMKLRDMDLQLALKMNIKTVADVARAHEQYRANIVELSLKQMSESVLTACRERGIKVMIYHQEKDPQAFGQILEWGADMVNLNHADVFLAVLRRWENREEETGGRE